MQQTTEIIFGNSIYVTMLNSKLKENEIILFNTIFSVGDLTDIDNFKIYVPKEIIELMQVYDFSKQINILNNAIKNNNKIRVWCSRKDSDSYILLTFICNYLKNIKCNLYVVYSDDYDNSCMSPAQLREEELEKASYYEQKLTNNDILELSKVWYYIKNNNVDIRIMENNKVKLVSYDYFDDIIINKLKELGEIKQVVLVANLLSNFHLIDLIFVYLINRLIKDNKIVIIKKSVDNNEYNNIISIR